MWCALCIHKSAVNLCLILLLVRRLNTVHESLSSSSSSWYAPHQSECVSTQRRMYEYIVAPLLECAQNVYISFTYISHLLSFRRLLLQEYYFKCNRSGAQSNQWHPCTVPYPLRKKGESNVWAIAVHMRWLHFNVSVILIHMARGGLKYLKLLIH